MTVLSHHGKATSMSPVRSSASVRIHSGLSPVWRALVCTALVILSPACRPDDETASKDARGNGAPKHPARLLAFPETLWTDDVSVNAFVEHAMTTCASGNYEQFRLLWSAREDPLPRDEYNEGWQAVQQIKVRALEKVILTADPQQGREESETAYVILADVSLDPAHPAGQREPNREAVLMLVREQGAWRLGRAPKPVRIWVKERVSPGNSDSTIPGGDRAEPLEGPLEPGGRG